MEIACPNKFTETNHNWSKQSETVVDFGLFDRIKFVFATIIFS